MRVSLVKILVKSIEKLLLLSGWNIGRTFRISGIDKGHNSGCFSSLILMKAFCCFTAVSAT